MRIVPLRPNQLFVLIAAGILPTLPLALFVLPLDQLIGRGVQALLPL